MGKLQRIWEILTSSAETEFIDETSQSESVGVKDLLRFMERQSEVNSQLIHAVLQTSASQADTMKTYIELFKPQQVKSTSMEERELMREESLKVRESEWEKVEDLKTLLGSEVPPDPAEW